MLSDKRRMQLNVFGMLLWATGIGVGLCLAHTRIGSGQLWGGIIVGFSAFCFARALIGFVRNVRKQRQSAKPGT